ncbi:hypothetical protein LBYZC6_01190 [Lacrimispora brassicae]
MRGQLWLPKPILPSNLIKVCKKILIGKLWILCYTVVRNNTCTQKYTGDNRIWQKNHAGYGAW